MQTAVERVMQTYGLMVSLTAEQEREARVRVSRFLEDKGSDEHKLNVPNSEAEGVRQRAFR
jgi:hypothetical protein